jgi:oligosaccharide reducing-end xylanase
MFNEFGYKLTLFTVTGWGPNWTNLRNAASAGHEVASHTVTHPHLSGMTIEQQTTELVNSQNSINTNVTSQKCITLAYPYCEPGNQALTAQHYIAARHCQGYIEGNTPGNFYQISSLICGNQGSVKTTADFNTRFESTATSKGWCVFLIHGIDNDGGYSPLPSTTLRASLEYLDARKSKFWVSTFGNIVRYVRERKAVSVQESSNRGTCITLQVTDTLDNAIYNYPITIRRPLPQSWSSANVSQNGQAVNACIVEVDSIKYVMFDVVPDGGDVVLSKPPPAAPASLTATAGYATVVLNWNDNSESDLAGYNVYRSTTSGSGYSKLNSLLLSSSNYDDDSIPHDTTYYYVVTAVNTNSNESGYSNEVFGGLYGDFTGNDIVEINDLSVFLNFWLANDYNKTAGVDLDEDHIVNFYEFAVLAENWLRAP